MMKRVQSCSYTVWASELAPYLPHIAQLLRSKPRRKIALFDASAHQHASVPRVPELDDMVDTVVEMTKSTRFANRRSTGTVLVPLSSRGRVNATAQLRRTHRSRRCVSVSAADGVHFVSVE